jgi:hypothetical protein
LLLISFLFIFEVSHLRLVILYAYSLTCVSQEAYKFSEAFYSALGQQFGRPFEAAYEEAVANYEDFWAGKGGQADLKRRGKTKADVPILVSRKNGGSHDISFSAAPPPASLRRQTSLQATEKPQSLAGYNCASLPSSLPSGLARTLSEPLPSPSNTTQPPLEPLDSWLGEDTDPLAVQQPDALSFVPAPLSGHTVEPPPQAWTGSLQWFRDEPAKKPQAK